MDEDEFSRRKNEILKRLSRQAKQELEALESEAGCKCMLDGSPVGIATVSSNGRGVFIKWSNGDVTGGPNKHSIGLK